MYRPSCSSFFVFFGIHKGSKAYSIDFGKYSVFLFDVFISYSYFIYIFKSKYNWVLFSVAIYLHTSFRILEWKVHETKSIFFVIVCLISNTNEELKMKISSQNQAEEYHRGKNFHVD